MSLVLINKTNLPLLCTLFDELLLTKQGIPFSELLGQVINALLRFRNVADTAISGGVCVPCAHHALLLQRVEADRPDFYPLPNRPPGRANLFAIGIA